MSLNLRSSSSTFALTAIGAIIFSLAAALLASPGSQVLIGAAAFTDVTKESPGTTRRITVADLPKPFATKSVDNSPDIVPRPATAWPRVLPGFKVEQYATSLHNPRLIRTAPNGDFFVAESSAGDVRMFRGVDKEGKAQQTEIFVRGLHQPFGIAFYPPGPNPQYIYIANTDEVVRYPYQNGDINVRGPQQKIAELPGGGHLRGGGHWTRDIAFSSDGKKMWVSVGSHSNVDDADNNPTEKNRADILEFSPDGSNMRVYASGIRNAVGIALNPKTNQLWCSVNERDGLGDNLVPDYITHVEDGGFYGWPWYYIGKQIDPRLSDKHPDLRAKMLTPDVLVQPHSASLQMTFYDGKMFPSDYEGDAFAAEHGSWNRAHLAGYEVVRVPLHQSGQSTGEYQDFLTGFVTADGKLWGRPVGVAVGKDGSLLVTDDGSDSIWRVTYGK